MALLHSEGFGKYGPVGSTFASVQQVFDTGYVLSGSGSVNYTQGFRPDNMALSLSRTSSAAPKLRYDFTSTADIIVVGFELSSSARFDGFFSIPGVVSIDWPNSMAIEGNSGAAIPILNTGYYVELKIVKSTKAYTMKLNGYAYIDGVLNAATIPDAMTLQWGFPVAGTSANFKFSNIILIDSSPGKYQDLVGPQSIRDDRPTSSVTPIEWDPVPANKTNVEIMQNNPPLPSQYTKSDVVGESDYYTSSAAISGNVTAVTITSIIGKTDIDSQKVKIGIGGVANRKEGAELEIEVQPKYMTEIFETSEDDTDWDAAKATSAPFGVTIQPRP